MEQQAYEAQAEVEELTRKWEAATLKAGLQTLFFHRLSGPGLQFSYEKIWFKTIVFYRENGLTCKKNVVLKP